jgi:uncharacterized delta-60 repeat protein
MKKIISTFFIKIFFTTITFSQVGNIDESFNYDDLGFGFGSGISPSGVRCSAVQGDGKVIVGGYFTHYNSNLKNRIVRINVNGSIDTSFNVGSGISGFLTSSLSQVLSVQIQTDGKIIVSGNFSTYNGILRKGIARLNSDGSLDLTFDPGNIALNTINCSVIRNDGKIIIVGGVNGGIARLNSDGSIDNSFNSGIVATGTVQNIKLQNDGKIIIGGGVNGGIARLNSDGSLDNSFNSGILATGIIQDIKLQNDGKIIIGGGVNGGIARLNSDGSLDNAFNIGTGANGGQIYSLAIQNNGKIIIGGNFTSFNGIPNTRLTRLNSDGSIDNSFIVLFGASSSNLVNSILIQNDSKIIIGGEFGEINGVVKWNIARLNINGSIDQLYNLGTGVSDPIGSSNSVVNTTCIQNDGKIILGGRYYTYNGVICGGISRINLDGSIDTTFNQGTGVGSFEIYCSAIQSDGKIILGGSFNSYNGTLRNNIVRINPDGSLDPSFNTSGTFPNGSIYSLAIQSDGKIIIGGDFTYLHSNNTVQSKNIARLNSNGSIDLTFNPGSGANNKIYALSIQSNGKILVGGSFSTFNGATKNCITRLNSNGSNDATLNLGTGAQGGVMDIKIQSDDKILIAGGFSSYNGISRNRIARLNLDGTIDGSFNPGSGADNTINTISIQSDGKIITGGSFTSFNGSQKKTIMRLYSDGTIDSTFDSGEGAQSYLTANVVGTIFSSSIQNDGRVIIGGDFTAFNGIGRNRITRIYGGEPCIISTNSIANNTYCAGASFNVSYSLTGNVYSGNVFTVQLSDANGSFASTTNIGTISSTSNGTIMATIPINQPFGTNYRIRVVSSQPFYASADNGNNITINTAPSSPGIINGNTTVCNGSSNSYSINSINGATSYTWSLPNGWSGLSSSASINAISGTNGGNIVVIANNSCGSSPSQSLAVIVNTAAPSTPGLISGDNTICSESTYTYSISDVNDATSYTWTLPSGWGGSSTSTSINITSNNIGGIIEITANNSCGSSSPQVLSVTVNPLPNVFAGNDQTICNGQGVTLNATGATSYAWNNSVTNNTAFTPTSSNTYIVVGTDVNGCQDSDTVNVTVNSLPNVNAGNDQTTCIGQSVTLNASGATTYSWNNSVVNNSPFTPSSTNTYVVVGTDANGCQDSDTVNITVNQNTASQITQTVNSSYTLNGQTYTQSGTYTQVIPNANGCDSTITLNLTINSSSIEEVMNSTISIYPNPASNQITISFAGQIHKVEIMDAKGATVYSSNENKKEISLPSSIQTGYYLVLVHTQEVVFRKELIVNN